MQPSSHLSDQQLLLALENDAASGAQAHLATCSACRERQQELAETLANFSRAYHAGLRPPESVPLIPHTPAFSNLALAAAAVMVLAAISVVIISSQWASQSRLRAQNEFAPRAALTPGAARSLNRQQVCSPEESTHLKNIAASVAQRIFAEYGIRNPRPGAYEVDYLIPPDLGGTADARNLWPQPYASGVWNARVKDALEDRLRMLVCDGQLDLGTAQKDLARDWIAAYKKYFATPQPLVSHAAFVKDRPWE